MDLSHMGTNRKEVRTFAFSGRVPEVGVDPDTGNLVLNVQGADGMGKNGQYDYKIVLTPGDLSTILKTVSLHRMAFKDSPLRAELESSAGAILRLLSAASALPFQLAPTELELKLEQARARIAAKHSKKSDV